MQGPAKRRATLVITAAAAAVAVVLTGCSSGSTKTPVDSRSTTVGASDTTSAAAPSSSTAALSGKINVLAAASLTGTFTTLGKQFKVLHPGVNIVFDFEASSAAAQQITTGARVDVFASASPKNMASVKAFVTTPADFVSNSLEIAVPPDNPGRVSGLKDLARKTVSVALCQPQVPCGALARTVLAKAKVTVKPKTLEADVKSTLGKVEFKSVDAGLVYVTDVRAAGARIKGIVIPATVNASTEYPIATLAKAPNATVAKAFVQYVLSPQGQKVLLAAGFSRP
jgi:molybdate transport system substrate-binding protein